MIEILTLLESFLKIISTIISTGFSIKKLIELKDETDWTNENYIFIASIVFGFFLGLFWSYIQKK